MIKVIVVDDEPLILDNIRKMIEGIHKDFKVVGEAYDGEDALPLIEQLNPDVLFTDVRMPVMDGLTLLGEVKKRGIKLLPVILSGYQEFEYAKHAMRLGVLDYLLKPLSINALEMLLNDLFEKVEIYRMEKQVKIFENIIRNKYVDLSNNEPKNYLNEKYYSNLLLCSGSYTTFPCNWISPQIDFWFKTNLAGIISGSIDGTSNYWILDGDLGNEKIIIFGSELMTAANLQNISERIHDKLSLSDFPVTTVVGGIVQNPFDLRYTVKLSRVLLNERIMFGKSSIIIPGQSTNSNSQLGTNTVINSSISTLPVLIQNNQIDFCKHEIRKILAQLENESCTQLRLERALKKIIIVFKETLAFMSEDRISYLEMEINELISNSITYQAIYEGFCIIIDDFFAVKKQKLDVESNQKDLINKIEQYIFANYTKQISLQTIAQAFGLVAPYLSKSYKNLHGISPTEQIIQLRIKRAKELLVSQPTLLLKDISELVGYEDPFYFSRVFKSLTGKSPSEYKAENPLI